MSSAIGAGGALEVRLWLRRWHPRFWMRVCQALGRVELVVTLRASLARLAQILGLVCFAIVLLVLAGCGSAHTVATDVEVLDRPVEAACTIEWPEKPVAHVALVQLSGDIRVDLVRIWRAAEAELEERIAYEKKLEAAARRCLEEGRGRALSP